VNLARAGMMAPAAAMPRHLLGEHADAALIPYYNGGYLCDLNGVK
jgi:hypothetical protein